MSPGILPWRSRQSGLVNRLSFSPRASVKHLYVGQDCWTWPDQELWRPAPDERWQKFFDFWKKEKDGGGEFIDTKVAPFVLPLAISGEGLGYQRPEEDVHEDAGKKDDNWSVTRLPVLKQTHARIVVRISFEELFDRVWQLWKDQRSSDSEGALITGQPGTGMTVS